LRAAATAVSARPGTAAVAVASGAPDVTAAFTAETAITWKVKRFFAATAPSDDDTILERISAFSYVGGAAASIRLTARGRSRAATAAIETAGRPRSLAADKDR
jgi:hypothetical protein